LLCGGARSNELGQIAAVAVIHDNSKPTVEGNETVAVPHNVGVPGASTAAAARDERLHLAQHGCEC
jgi:hypothetical protein